MAQLSAVLRNAVDGGLMFWCPGCGGPHQIKTGAGAGPRWGYNGNAERPTFTPSVRVTSGHYCSGHKAGDSCWCTYSVEHPEDPQAFKCGVCHSFVTDGRIQFLTDSTHALAGQTVDLPPWPAPPA